MQGTVAVELKPSVDTKDIFISTDFQYRAVREWNDRYGWGFTQDDFEALGNPPMWPSGPLQAVILTPRFSSVKETFENSWKCFSDIHPEIVRQDDMASSEEGRLALMADRKQERGLSWKVVDLAGHWNAGMVYQGCVPSSIRTEFDGPWPAEEILWAGCLFPKWVKSMDGATVPYVYLSGYKVSPTTPPSWMRLPYLANMVGSGKIELSTAHHATNYRGRSFPEYVRYVGDRYKDV